MTHSVNENNVGLLHDIQENLDVYTTSLDLYMKKFEEAQNKAYSQLSISPTVKGPTHLFETSRVRLIE